MNLTTKNTDTKVYLFAYKRMQTHTIQLYSWKPLSLPLMGYLEAISRKAMAYLLLFAKSNVGKVALGLGHSTEASNPALATMRCQSVGHPAQ